MIQPITETSNPLTEEIDIASPSEIVQILKECDQEVFKGFQDYKSLFHDDTISTIEGVADCIRGILQGSGDGIIVFGGCGTSGRLGYVVARTFNELLVKEGRPEMFHYALAGGDKALFTSQEAPEDDPYIGVETLKKLSRGKSNVVFIGITCGLSAPYVAGQLDYCMDHMDLFTPVLLGFNPTELARNRAIETWDKTFLRVVQRMQSCDSGDRPCYILNPVVGPEPITGSSRMKGGTVTKLVLETLCMKAFTGAFHPDQHCGVIDYLNSYRLISRSVYEQKTAISSIIQLCGNSLRENGNIYYLGFDSLAIMALIDASECPPTYGATLDDVRGFVHQGYQTLRNTEGNLSSLGRHFRISLDDFRRDIELTERDTVIVINKHNSAQLPDNVGRSRCKKVLVVFDKIQSPEYDLVLSIVLPSHEILALIGDELLRMSNQLFREIAIKWCLNAITTGAHILNGKVYRNIMVDVKVSNSKLFYRAIEILKTVGKLTEEASSNYLLRSIYDTDNITEVMRNAPTVNHVVQATPKDKVVPVALVSALMKCSVSEARDMISRHAIVRSCIVHALKTAS